MKKHNAPTTKALEDTKLNQIVKNLPLKQKKDFKQKLLNHPFIWAPQKTKEQRERAFNNWRYKGQGEPSFPTKIHIYSLLSEYIDVKINDVFGDIDHNYVYPLINLVKEINQEIKKYNYYDTN